MPLQIEAQSNYNAVLNAFKNPKISSIGLEGGTRSGKTFDWSIFLYQYLLKYNNKKIVIGRDTKSSLNITTYKTIQDIFRAFDDPKYFPKNALTMRIYNNEIDFVGLNDSDTRAHGLESDLLIINEADLCNEDTFNQMEQRNKEFIIMDYNPRHVTNWTYERERLDYHVIHHTTILDNKYAPTNAVRKVMTYEPTTENVERGTADEYLWKVYGLGVRAEGEDAVFKRNNLFRCNENEIPSDDVCSWVLVGMDFGYSHDPTTAGIVKRYGNKLFIQCIIYETGLLNSDTSERLKKHDVHNKYVTICDSASPQNIDELNMLGIPADGCEKSPGSVAYSIAHLQQLELHFCNDPLTDLVYQEFINARWQKDRQGNYKYNTHKQRILGCKDIKVSSEGNEYVIKDHGIDFVRYAATYYLEPYEKNE